MPNVKTEQKANVKNKTQTNDTNYRQKSKHKQMSQTKHKHKQMSNAKTNAKNKTQTNNKIKHWRTRGFNKKNSFPIHHHLPHVLLHTQFPRGQAVLYPGVKLVVQ